MAPGGSLDGSHPGRRRWAVEVESIRGSETTIQLLGEPKRNIRELESFYYCNGQNWKTLRKRVVGDDDGIGAR